MRTTIKLKAPGAVILAAYLISALIVAGMLYYWYTIASAPQPILSISYNTMLNTASGFMENDLGYPILVTYFYCTVPGGHRYTFSYNNQTNRLPNDNAVTMNSYLGAGVNAPVFLTLATNLAIPDNCTGWKVNYYKVT